MKRNTVCLVMICYNNADTILATLKSVAPFIDHAVFIDNMEGSTDETEEIVREWSEIRPSIDYVNYNKPFTSYAQKRNYAFDRARMFYKDEYMLVLDSDNILDAETNPFNDLTADAYSITKQQGTTEYQVLHLFKSSLHWEYVGVVHEYPALADGSDFTQAHLPGVIVHEQVKEMGEGPGQRSRMHYYDHALMIECELRRNKSLSQMQICRYTFYLAQSYKDAGMIVRAIDAYKARAALGGWAEEVFYSLYMISVLKQAQNAPKEHVLLAAVQAWNYRPQRLEAAYMLMYLLDGYGFDYAAWCIGIGSVDLWDQPLHSDDLLLVDRNIYNNLFPDLMKVLAQKRTTIQK